MEGDILYLKTAYRELKKLPRDVQRRFLSIFKEKSEGHELPGKKFKAITRELSEARVKTKSGIYRGICGYVSPNIIVVLFFKKKTSRLPKRFLETAKKRFNSYKNGQ